MKTRNCYPIDQQTVNDELRSTSGSAKREHTFAAEASRVAFLAVALMASSMIFAQDTPGTPSTPQTPTTTPHSIEKAPTNPTSQGWTMFDNNVGTHLKLNGDQLSRLKEVDGRYQDRYTALGKTPWTNAGYTSLTEQRNKDIKGILTPEQYDHWMANYGGRTPKKPMHEPAGKSSTHNTVPKTTPPTTKP